MRPIIPHYCHALSDTCLIEETHTHCTVQTSFRDCVLRNLNSRLRMSLTVSIYACLHCTSPNKQDAHIINEAPTATY